ncbi:flavonoid 3'-monooxygenase-like [Vicia villosa]|uniref:flavonoid 3'-monooxygenase-like n=1 Tax=Vicia villosa TaxID=3911 RepID=UPI00273ADA1A|nr:flavonoid 3'-monooxygenase-like [Vicia villosa]
MSLWFIALSTFILSILIYRFLKSTTTSSSSLPLPPGPKPWPIIGNMPHLGSAPHQSLAALAQTYGPLMHLKLGFVDAVVVASATVAEQFLKVHDANFSSRPPNAAAKNMVYNYQDLVFAPYGPRWRLLRKISSVHLFSNKVMAEFQHIREEEAARLTSKLASNNSDTKAVKLGQLLSVCTTNALARAMLGRKVFKDDNRDNDPKADDFKNMILESMVLGGVFNISDFIPSLEWLDLQGVQAKMKILHKKFDAFLTNIIEEHETSNSKSEKHKDLLTTLLALRDEGDDDGNKLTNIEIKALLLNMFVAGTDTSSSTTEWAIAELIKNPKILAQVQQELDNVVGRDRSVKEEDLPNLPYLHAVIKETFRLHPSTPLSLPRIASESCEIFGYHIPKGATVLVNVWAIARDPKQWVDPLVFNPERFLPGGDKCDVDIKGNDFEVIPFGAGRRICVGMSLGLRMVQLLTATLAHSFNWELENGIKPEKMNMDEAFGLTLQRAVPLSVYPKPRLSPNVYSSCF